MLRFFYFLRVLPVFAVQILLSNCTTRTPTATPPPLNLASIFPAANAIPGWEISEKVQTYTHDNLFSLVDGQAESFFAYGFVKVAVQRYQDTSKTLLNIEIWQLVAPVDAYGLFSSLRSGSPVSIGNEGDSDPGRRLVFWQDRYFVSLEAMQHVPDKTLQAFGHTIAGKLPIGGERPALVARLPQSGLDKQGIIFFHEEISIQTEVWLGGENLLGLSHATDGMLGRYQVHNETVRLLLVQYPTSAQATQGLNALQIGNVADLLASDVRGSLLGAVFGKFATAQAQSLLQEALK